MAGCEILSIGARFTERADSGSMVGGDESGVFQDAFEHRLQRAVERGVVGAVFEVGDHNRHRVRFDIRLL